jgi:hypothetical protein
MENLRELLRTDARLDPRATSAMSLPLHVLQHQTGCAADERVDPGLADFLEDLVHASRDVVRGVSGEVFRQRFGVQLASRLARPLRVPFGVPGRLFSPTD